MPQIALFPTLAGLVSGLTVLPVISSVFHVIQRRSALKREKARLKNTTFLLSGTIEEKQLIPHIYSLCKLERQGVLHIITGRRKGYLLFRNGEIIDGFYRNHTGEEGVHDLLTLTEGDYYFESRAVLQPNLVRKSINKLLK